MRSSRSRSGTSCAFRPVLGEGTRVDERASRSSSSVRLISARTRGETSKVGATGGLTERRSVEVGDVDIHLEPWAVTYRQAEALVCPLTVADRSQIGGP